MSQPGVLPGIPAPNVNVLPTFPPVAPAPKRGKMAAMKSKNKGVSDEKLHFDFPGSDIVLSSWDSHDFRVPHLYLANGSPVLRDLIRGVLNTADVANREEQDPLPVIKLPESGAILHNLLTFVFPVAPILPSTTEKIMELLAVAQKYQMDSVLTHVRAISQQHLSSILPESALYVYFLAQKYELHQEVLQAARSTLRLSMTIEDLEGKLEFVPGAYLRELWKYHQGIRTNLKSRLLEFRNTDLPNHVKGLRCADPPSPGPQTTWLDDYIQSLVESPHLFDLIEFENLRSRHITCSQRPCTGISSQAIRTFWDSLTAVVNGIIEEVR